MDENIHDKFLFREASSNPATIDSRNFILQLSHMLDDRLQAFSKPWFGKYLGSEAHSTLTLSSHTQ